MTNQTTVNNQETKEEESITFCGVTYTGEALEELIWTNSAREALECWERANWHYSWQLPAERYMLDAHDYSTEIPYDKFDILEDYAEDTLLSALKAMGAYIAQGNFSGDPEHSEAKMRAVFAWLDGWNDHYNTSTD